MEPLLQTYRSKYFFTALAMQILAFSQPWLCYAFMRIGKIRIDLPSCFHSFRSKRSILTYLVLTKSCMRPALAKEIV